MQRLLKEWSNGGHYNATLETLCRRIADIVEEPRESVTLCISGMASIYAALKSLLALVDHAMAAADDTDVVLSEETKHARQMRLREFGKVVVFGFPYLVSE
jgi:cystathionine beta-lyase/cystathionine gamma-synthase